MATSLLVHLHIEPGNNFNVQILQTFLISYDVVLRVFLIVGCLVLDCL